MEADVFRSTIINAAIHCAKEEVGFVAEADFGVGVFHREPGEATDVGYGNAARTRAVCWPVLIRDRQSRVGCKTRMEAAGSLMQHFGFLTAEQKRGIHTPIESQGPAFGTSDD